MSFTPQCKKSLSLGGEIGKIEVHDVDSQKLLINMPTKRATAIDIQ